jgi:hypothetical protein
LLAEIRQNNWLIPSSEPTSLGIRFSREIFAVAILNAFRRKTDMRKMRQYHAIDVVDGARSPGSEVR